MTFIKAALNGGRLHLDGSCIPIRPHEIAQDVLRVEAAGANAVHVHARDSQGMQSITPEDIGQVMQAIRSSGASLPIGTTTGLWTTTSHQKRLDLIRNWDEQLRPDFASVTFAEEGGDDVCRLLLNMGIELETAVWQLSEVPLLLNSQAARRSVRILIEPEDTKPNDAVRHSREMAASIRADHAFRDIPLCYHGYDQTVWDVVDAALIDGAQVRVGFEDGTTLRNGTTARTNAILVEEVLNSAYAKQTDVGGSDDRQT